MTERLVGTVIYNTEPPLLSPSQRDQFLDAVRESFEMLGRPHEPMIDLPGEDSRMAHQMGVRAELGEVRAAQIFSFLTSHIIAVLSQKQGLDFAITGYETLITSE